MSRRTFRKKNSVTDGPQGPFLHEVHLMPDRIKEPDACTFNLPVVRAFDNWKLHPRVTVLIGENGSGESPLLEVIAIAWGFNAEGRCKNFRFETTPQIASDLQDCPRLSRGLTSARDGFFLRVEC